MGFGHSPKAPTEPSTTGSSRLHKGQSLVSPLSRGHRAAISTSGIVLRLLTRMHDRAGFVCHRKMETLTVPRTEVQ